jgi:AcrR family transcriptional regulator
MSSDQGQRGRRRAAAGGGHAAKRTTKEIDGEVQHSGHEGSIALIWSRPEPTSRKPGLTRERIAAVALGLADTEGLEAVSMRRVANELGVGTMSLYYYVRTKDELLTLMHNAMIAELLVPDDELPAGWRPALELIAHRSREAFHRHPWAIEGLPISLGPNAMRHGEQSLAAVDALGVDAATKFELITMVDDYVFGCALRELQNSPTRLPEGGGEPRKDAMAAYIDEQLATGNFPHTERIFGRGEARETIQGIGRLADPGENNGRFERGLKRLLDGIAVSLPETRRSDAS